MLGVGEGAGAPAWQQLWQRFQGNVLQLVAEACTKLVQADVDCKNWKENQFSWQLFFNLEGVCRDADFGYFPEPQYEEFTEEELHGGKDPDKAPKIDLVIRLDPVQRDVYFGIEAKILVHVRVRNYWRHRMSERYVIEGIGRYTDGRYSSRFRSAMMVGYVISGDFDNLDGDINRSIRNHHIPCEKELTRRTPGAFDLHYWSTHPRQTGDSIELHHFFPVFKLA